MRCRLLAAGHGPQARGHPVPAGHCRFLYHWRVRGGALAYPPLTPEGTLFTPETYTNFVTLHGVVLVFFFLVPSMPCVSGPSLMLGSKGLAFPRLNLASWYLFVLGAGGLRRLRSCDWRRGPRLDLLHSPGQRLLGQPGRADRHRRVPRLLFLDADGPQPHRYYPQAACAGNDLGAASAIRLDYVRHQFASGTSGRR